MERDGHPQADRRHPAEPTSTKFAAQRAYRLWRHGNVRRIDAIFAQRELLATLRRQGKISDVRSIDGKESLTGQ
jgi:hypothetical protein